LYPYVPPIFVPHPMSSTFYFEANGHEYSVDLTRTLAGSVVVEVHDMGLALRYRVSWLVVPNDSAPVFLTYAACTDHRLLQC
jgi:hypothetical protein